MAAQFPGIKPTERSFRMGQYATKIYRALSGATVKRNYGNRAFGYELRLQFDNIADSVTTQLLTHYESTQGGFERFTLPAELFAGMSAALTGKIQSPTQIQWEYAGPPEVQSVQTNVSKVTIALTGELTY